MRLALLVPVLAVAACVEAMPPREEGRTPRSIAYCYSPSGTGLAEVTNKAQAYCQTMGLNARKSAGGDCQQVSWSPARSWERATFDCVP